MPTTVVVKEWVDSKLVKDESTMLALLEHALRIKRADALRRFKTYKAAKKADDGGLIVIGESFTLVEVQEVAKEMPADLAEKLGLTEEQLKEMREAGIIK